MKKPKRGRKPNKNFKLIPGELMKVDKADIINLRYRARVEGKIISIKKVGDGFLCFTSCYIKKKIGCHCTDKCKFF